MEMEARDHPIDKLYKRRDRFEIPDYQREEVWSTPQKQLLIDSILNGWKLPKLYLLKTGTNTYDVVDGQQRLSTIFEFMAGKLELSKETSENFGGAKTYKELEDDASDKFDDFRVEFDEIVDASDDEIREFFKRLQAGLTLNGPERLNAVPGNLTEYVRALADHAFFTETVPFKDRRYSHFDVAAKFAAIEIEGLDVGQRIGDLEELFLSQKSFSKESQTAKQLKSAMSFLRKSLGKDYKGLRLRSVTQSVLTVVAALQRSGMQASQTKEFRDFLDNFTQEWAKQVDLGLAATDADYLAFQRTVNANVKTGPRTRHEILLRKLFQFNPKFLSNLPSVLLADAGVEAAIKDVAEDIQDVISDINDIYSSKNGKDLFKSTNKTVAAQNSLKSAITNVDQYGKLIEALYFLFWEGPGSKLSEKPKSFADVNALRTELQHDVDHGKDKDVAKKKKKAGEVFAQLSGTSSPKTASGEALQVAQLKLLSDIRRDLIDLADTVAEDAKS